LDSDKSLRKQQRGHLYQLLMTVEMPNSDVVDTFIDQLTMEMDEEDVAYVQQRVHEQLVKLRNKEV